MAKKTWVVEVSLPGTGPVVGYFVLANNRAEAEEGVRSMINLVGCSVVNTYLYDSCTK